MFIAGLILELCTCRNSTETMVDLHLGPVLMRIQWHLPECVPKCGLYPTTLEKSSNTSNTGFKLLIPNSEPKRNGNSSFNKTKKNRYQQVSGTHVLQSHLEILHLALKPADDLHGGLLRPGLATSWFFMQRVVSKAYFSISFLKPNKN